MKPPKLKIDYNKTHRFTPEKGMVYSCVCGNAKWNPIHKVDNVGVDEGGGITYDDFTPGNYDPDCDICGKPWSKCECSGFTQDAYSDWTEEDWSRFKKDWDKKFNPPAYEVVDYTPKSDVLVIHPTDESTAFMDHVYKGKGYDVLNSFTGDLALILPHYSRVIMIGHGWVDGQFSVGQFRGDHLVINKRLAPYLKDKNNTYIWCKAADFVKKHKLKGYSTGMFISELGEAVAFNIKSATEKMVYNSNMLYAEVMRNCIDGPPTLQKVLEGYVGNDPVTKYNRSQMRQF